MMFVIFQVLVLVVFFSSSVLVSTIMLDRIEMGFISSNIRQPPVAFALWKVLHKINILYDWGLKTELRKSWAVKLPSKPQLIPDLQLHVQRCIIVTKALCWWIRQTAHSAPQLPQPLAKGYEQVPHVGKVNPETKCLLFKKKKKERKEKTKACGLVLLL